MCCPSTPFEIVDVADATHKDDFRKVCWPAGKKRKFDARDLSRAHTHPGRASLKSGVGGSSMQDAELCGTASVQLRLHAAKNNRPSRLR